MRVYLAGPISGCTFGECTDWREYFKTLIPKSIQCLSPMRGKDFLRAKGVITDSYEKDGPLATQRGIMTRDFFDCTRSDLVVANLLGTEIVTIGTCMEIAWAFMNRTPLIVVMEKHGNIHDHPMIREAIGYRLTSLEDAADVVQSILWPQETEEFVCQ